MPSPALLNRWPPKVLAPASFLGLMPWIVLVFWVSPSADDFCYFASVRQHGWAGAQLWWYGTHSGRFSATALQTGVGWLIDSLSRDVWTTLRFVALADLALIWLLGWRFVRIMAGHWPRAWRLVATNIMVSVLLVSLVNAKEAVYWLNAAMAYLPPALFVWWLLQALARMMQDDVSPEPGETAGLTVAAFVAAGMNELVAPTVIAVLAGMAYLQWRRRHPASDQGRLLLIALATLIGFAVVVLAPGNAMRLDAYPGSRDVLAAPLRGAAALLAFLVLRLGGTPALIGWLGVAGLVSAQDARRRHREPAASSPLWLMPALFLVVGWVELSIGYFSMGSLLPTRAQNMLFVFGFVALTTTAIWWGRGPGGAALIERLGPRRQRRLLLVMAAICLSSATIWISLYDAALSGPRFLAQNRERVRLIEGAPGADVAVPALSAQPTLLFVSDLSTDPQHWYNRCVADYFGKRSVTAR
jgi:hypothetical protein